MKRQVKLALIQMRVQWGNRRDNLARAGELVAIAAENGADIVLLPEAMDIGWTHPDARDLASSIPDGPVAAAYRTYARNYQVILCAGLTERDGENVYNSAILISEEGEILLRHRKLNELEIGHSIYDAGQSLETAETALGRIGVLICADAFAQDYSLLKSLGYMQADLILSPSAWATPPGHNPVKDPYGLIWHKAYQPVAKDFQIPIAGCSNVGPVVDGPWKGYNCIGSSLIYGPDGECWMEGPHGVNAEALLIAELPVISRPARGVGWANLWKSSPTNTGE